MNLQINKYRLKPLILSLAIFLGFSTFTRLFLFSLCIFKAEATLLQAVKIFFAGFVYDVAFFSYFSIVPLIWFLLLPSRIWNWKPHQLLLKIGTLGFLGFCLFTSVAEYLFWDEFQCRFNFIAVDYLVYTGEVIDNIVQSYPIAAIFGWIFFAITVFYFLLRDMMHFEDSHLSLRYRIPFYVPLLCIPFLFGWFLDQDLRKVSDNTFQVELASNGPYQFVAAFRNNEMKFESFYPTIDSKKAGEIVRKSVKSARGEFISSNPLDILQKVQFSKPARKMNVILVMVESLSSHFLGSFGNKENLTPNLDKLAKNSLMFDQCYATGTRTTRGLEAVTLSIVPTPGRSIVKRIGRESGMISLGSTFNSHGYRSRFLYGGRGFFDNMNAFFEGNGYEITDQHSTPANEIGFQNAWGMADEYLFDQTLKKADEDTREGNPFFYHIMTTSNHRPYTYPSNRIDIPSGTGRQGAVKYSDWAIGDFLKKAESRPWFDNTLFVIVADHQASSAGKVSLPLERYHIPLLLYSPRHLKPEVNHKVCSQIDIAPTLLAFLGLDYTSTFFGRDILEKEFRERAFIATYQALGFYTRPVLRLMRPVKHLELHENANTRQPSVFHTEIIEKPYMDLIAHYQLADYIYQNGLNKTSRLKGMK